jgi:ABC-type multidrug transport system ATPase subunit
MEEADALCDRLGIFVGGELKCIGNSTELKSRYGKGYKLTITTPLSKVEEAHQYVFLISSNILLDPITQKTKANLIISFSL